ncbi:sensor histidine kinase [Hymenobacter sp. GOD-10R]|uniref:sensor histidine kinase n=1 Tax=Hymenobacter sp. GOD-10R TaxID=3093922 RepID=UPI002D772F46|nr:histidine kinase [Hymenobacter sp. GOD-10R]WRQ29005.1 histidine kinase [Hymenobacter sp. GOD-10R]
MFSYASVPAPSRLYWRAQLLGWLLYAIFNLALFIGFGQFTRDSVLITVVIVLPLLALTHGLRYHIKANGWERLAPLPLLSRLLLINLLLSVVSQLIIWALIIWLVRPVGDGQPHGWGQFIGYALNVNFVLWLWEGFYFGWHYLRSYKQAEVDKWKLAAAVREAEMRTLKAQINPHFMFNGLNNIRALVMEDPSRARQMITHLSDLLRYSIQLNSTEQVPLARELEIVEHYLELEAVQLEERLAYSLDVDKVALPTLIPPMTLQLLVENAIKHGIAPRPDGGAITLTARANLGTQLLYITVRNTGHYAPKPGHEGVGLRNAQERLHLLYGKHVQLVIGNDPVVPATVLAELRLPLTPHTQSPPTEPSFTSTSSTLPFPTA